MSANDLFNWSGTYHIGIQEVDEQHQVLVSLLNELHEAIEERQDKAACREVLDRLAEYTRTHFLLEESLMRLTHYPGFETHQRQHEELVQEVQALQHRLDAEDAPITVKSLHFLKDWLIEHINDSDKRFGTFFQTAGLSQYAAWSNEVQTTMRKKKWWWKFW